MRAIIIMCIILVFLILIIPGSESIKSFKVSSWPDKLPKNCGWTRFDTTKKIVGGERSSLGQLPWIARIGYETGSLKTFFNCGGSLITKFYVVTAAHCEEENDIVRLGENYIDENVDCDETGMCAPQYQDIKIKKHIYHSKYNDEDIHNDYGLIELKKPAEFNDFVQPICLPPEVLNHKDFYNEEVSIAGFGIINSKTENMARNLMYIKVPIVNESKCNAMYIDNLIETQWCIGNGVKDSCEGDSGGPVSMVMDINGEKRAVLIGVVSYGSENCGDGPAVYTDVSRYLDWTLEHITKE